MAERKRDARSEERQRIAREEAKQKAVSEWVPVTDAGKRVKA